MRAAPRYYRNFRLSHHGTRGLLSAGLAGEAVAALACGQLPPLPAPTLSALAPGLRVKRTE